ncbi:MAG: hypothetical protein ACYTAF_01555 [Planctomycetota bacterium]|jgi:hypothetical protein
MSDETRDWMIGLQGHRGRLGLAEVVLLIRGGQLRHNEMVKYGSEPWRAAIDIPELKKYFDEMEEEKTTAREPEYEEEPPPDEEKKEEKPEEVAEAEPEEGHEEEEEEEEEEGKKSGSRLRARKGRKKKPGASTSWVKRIGRARKRGRSEEKPSARARKTERKAEMAAKLAETRSAAKPSDSEPALAKAKRPGPEETDTVTGRRGVRDEERRRWEKEEAPEPALVPMVARYYSVTDLTRYAAFAFAPRRILTAGIMLIPLFFVLGLLVLSAQTADATLRAALYILSGLLVLYTLTFTCTALAYQMRMHLEGEKATALQSRRFAVGKLDEIFVFPLVAILPSLLGGGILWLLGSLRDSGRTAAAALKAAYIVLFLLGLVVAAGVILLQLALFYIPSAMAIDVFGLRRSISETYGYIRRHTMRVIFHWFVITACVAVAAAVLLLLMWAAFHLPDWLYGQPLDEAVQKGWTDAKWPDTFYFLLGIGFVTLIPVSMVSTFGTLSYLVLVQEDEVFVAAPLLDAMAEETGLGLEGGPGSPEDTVVSEEEKGEPTEEEEGKEEEEEKKEEEKPPEEDEGEEKQDPAE